MVLGALAAIGLMVVHLRVEQARCAARIMAIEGEWLSARRELWALQARHARLRAPERIFGHATQLGAGLAPPGQPDSTNSQEHLALKKRSE
mgnify:CR=1 FL=1